MLVLTRKLGERIVIDGDIVVKILKVEGQKVRIGIEAPADVAVWREELQDRSSVSENRAVLVGQR